MNDPALKVLSGIFRTEPFRDRLSKDGVGSCDWEEGHELGREFPLLFFSRRDVRELVRRNKTRPQFSKDSKRFSKGGTRSAHRNHRTSYGFSSGMASPMHHRSLSPSSPTSPTGARFANARAKPVVVSVAPNLSEDIHGGEDAHWNEDPGTAPVLAYGYCCSKGRRGGNEDRVMAKPRLNGCALTPSPPPRSFEAPARCSRRKPFLPSTGQSFPSPFVFVTLVTGPRRSLSLKLSDTRVYEPQIRAPEAPTRCSRCKAFLARIGQRENYLLTTYWSESA